ncbi:hypothetical protein UFOVP255_24 [uncultured Caudovirales phage]|uniref:Uncharacterized protein n=1 Tax=uncultured Caudovirales phage TaxID=2100421 RepID=A0A6J5LHJ0_9CAUD|nr:hypothetical protein UFOVP255_24 [uncultured Caudovirales phage]
MSKLLETSLIDGKPFGGLFFGSYLPYIDPSLKEELKDRLIGDLKDFQGFEIRHLQWIDKESRAYLCEGPLREYSTLALKFMAWGRAYKVHRIFKKGIKRRKRSCWINNGRRKH